MVAEEPKSYTTEFKDDAGSISLATYTPNSPEEKKLLRKLDLRIGMLSSKKCLLWSLISFPFSPMDLVTLLSFLFGQSKYR